MILTRRVALNGNQLDQVDSRIVISGIEPGDGKENISAVDAASGFGQRITSNRRSTVDMVVKFRLMEHGRDVTALGERAEILEKVNAWAAPGGVMTVNYKTGRQLNVILVQAPGEGSLWDYTKEFTLTFRAYAVPYWEDSTESTETIATADDSGSKNITVGGSAETQADIEVTNGNDGTLDTLTLTIGGKQMAFTGLGVGAGEKLVIDHADGMIRIRKTYVYAYVSVMACRTGADDFFMAPGTVACSYTAGQDCTVKVNWRNRYL